MDDQPKLFWFEKDFFLFFGIFHIHRVWGLIDRKGYSDFWLSVMNNRDWFYFALAGLLLVFCIMGIVIFIKNRDKNYWWRWIYLFGGAYLLFDLFAISVGLDFWERLLYWMYDITNPYWNILWGTFIGLGVFSSAIGISITRKLLRCKSIIDTDKNSSA